MTIAEERLRPNTSDDSELLFHWHRYQAIRPLTVNQAVLEIGFGDGYGAHFLNQSAASVMAVDIDPEAVKDARETYVSPHLTYQEASGLNLPFPDHHFDVVVAFEVIEHMERSDQEQFLQEVRRVLRQDGILALSTPDHTRTLELQADNPWHIGEVTADELKTLMRAYFPHVDLYYQDVSAASIMWNPEEPSHIAKGFSFDRTESGSTPAPVALKSHLPLVALASASPISETLSGFCTENDRGLLVRLWSQIGSLESTLSEERVRHHQEENAKQQVINDLREECMSLWRESRAMAEMVIEYQRIHPEYEQLLLERPALLKAQTQWTEVENSKAWQRLKRYWHWLDHSTPGRMLLWAKRRGRKV